MTALGWKADINQSRFWTPKREYLLLPIADIQTGKIRPKTRSAFGQKQSFTLVITGLLFRYEAKSQVWIKK